MELRETQIGRATVPTPPADTVSGVSHPSPELFAVQIRQHYERHLPDRTVRPVPPDLGIHRRLGSFSVVEMAPSRENDVWAYASVGAWVVPSTPRTEFFLIAPRQSERAGLLVTMAAHYHANADAMHQLGVGDTLPIGEPWLDDSLCDHLLVSRPYPFPPAIEKLTSDGVHIHFAWLLPITADERMFKIAHGAEALEATFERCGLQYWDPGRVSVV
jgi:hypothetical protein